MKGDIRYAVYTNSGCSDFEHSWQAENFASNTVERKISKYAVIVRWISDGACFQNSGIIGKYGEAP